MRESLLPPRLQCCSPLQTNMEMQPAEREIHSYIIGFDLTNMQLLFAFTDSPVHDFKLR